MKPPLTTPARPAPRSTLTPLLLCLFLSGCGSLVLEAVWSRALRLVFGSTTLAISTVLAAYMLGLGLGGLWGGRRAVRVERPALWYVRLELAIAVVAIAILPVFDRLPGIQQAIWQLPFWPAAIVRFLLVLVVLILPTLFMGATLPLLVAAAERRAPETLRVPGLLYGINTLGAVFGVGVATFIGFKHLGLHTTNFLGAALDLSAAGLAWLWIARHEEPLEAPTPLTSTMAPTRFGLAALSYGAVGFTALTCEVAWTRTLVMAFGSSAYAFVTMLAAFLLGIALGSLLERKLLIDRLDPAAAYGWGLALLGLLCLVTFWLLQRMPDLVLVMMERFGTSGGVLVGAGLLASLLAMIGPTLVLGALFPLLVRAETMRGRRSAAAVGDLYFTNTVGSALGAFLAGFVLIPRLGLALTMALAIALTLLVAAALLWRAGRDRQKPQQGRLWAAAAAVAALLIVVVLPNYWDSKSLTRGLFYRPTKFLALGLPLEPFEQFPGEQIRYYKDGVSATISIHEENEAVDLRINGKPDASINDMPTQSLSGHLPMIFGPKPDDVLVIGFASGVTTGTAALYGPKKIDAVEIEPAILEASHFFDAVNYKPLEQPIVKPLLEDGRIFMAYTKQRYDVIVAEPSNPYLSGCANLFTKEFFAGVRRALKPGGRLVQWFQLYGMDNEGVGSVLQAMHSEFPYIYGFIYRYGWPDLLLMASERELTLDDMPRWEDLPETAQHDLMRIQIFSTADLWALLRLMPRDIEAITKNSPRMNTDDSMFVELHAPWLMTRPPIETTNMIDTLPGAIWELRPGQRGPLDAERLGQLALSHKIGRGDESQAKRLLAASQQGGRSGAGLTAASLFAAPPDDLRLLDEAAATGDTDVALSFARARWLMTAHRFDEALAVLDAAIARFPADPRPRQLRQQVYLQLGRLPEARADIQSIIDSPATTFENTISSDAARIDAKLGHWENAATLLRKFLARNPYRPPEWRLYAEALDKLGRRDEADVARRNVEIAHRNQIALTHRQARRAGRWGSPEKAKELLRTIIADDPSYQPALEDLKILDAGGRL